MTTCGKETEMMDDARAILAWIIYQAESAMAIAAGASLTSGDHEGALEMLNSIASDIAINAQMLDDSFAQPKEPHP